MKAFILQNIVSNNNFHTINTLLPKLHLKPSEVTVFFCAAIESNRHWNLQEKAYFDYKVLQSKRVELHGSDLFTYFINSEIWNLLSTENPDWIIVGGWDQFAFQVAVIWGKLHKKRVTLWSGSTKGESSWRRTVSYPLVKLLVHTASDYIAYGTRAKEYLVTLGAKEEKVLIHQNDVNSAYFTREAEKYRKRKESLKKKLQITSKRNFLYVGQLIERKGVRDLLQSYYHLSQKQKDWGLVIIGSGYLQSEIEEEIKKNKVGTVRVLGNVEQYDLPAYYVCCDCVVLPSREEVWGLVVNEALACGLSTIVSNICGCVPELTKQFPKRCHTFETGNIVALQRAMERFIKTVV